MSSKKIHSMQGWGGCGRKEAASERIHTVLGHLQEKQKTKKQEINTRDPVELGRGLCPLGPCRINPQVLFYIMRCCSLTVGVRANLTQLFRSFQ